MGRRYSRVKQGAKLKDALDNYVNYLQTAANRPSRIGTQGARDNTVRVFVQPFTITVAADEFCEARCSQDSSTKLLTVVNGASDAAATTTLGTNELIQLPKFRAARVIYFENSTRSVSVQSSDVTGLPYLKYAGERFSLPFGAQAATSDQMDAFLAAKAAILAANGAAAIKRVSLSREYIGLEAA